jgi:hypothetical protein
VSGWAGLHQEPNVLVARVSRRVQSASRYVSTISHPQELLLACHTNCQRTFEHLDALVLSNVYVQWDPATGIESHFQLEQLAVSVAAGLKDGYVLAGENVMEMITRRHEASLASERVRRQAGMVPSPVASRSRTTPAIHESGVIEPILRAVAPNRRSCNQRANGRTLTAAIGCHRAQPG